MDNTELTLGAFLIGLGFLFLAAEAFLPAHGLLFALGLGGIAVGLVLLFAHDTAVGLTVFLAVAVALPAAGALLLYLWPRTPIGRQLLGQAVPDETMADLPAHREREKLRGKYGKAVSALRPAGVVDFDGVRVDTLTEGMMVEPGQWVRCVEVRAGKVVVRPAAQPSVNIQDLETDLFTALDPEPGERG